MSGGVERVRIALLELNGIESFHLNSFPPANEAVVEDNFVFPYISREKEAPPSIDDRLAKPTTPSLLGGGVLVETGPSDVDVWGA